MTESKKGLTHVGAVAELLASADLLRRGYHVFRAVSAACSCDLIAVDVKTILRIEVTTGHEGPEGVVRHHKNWVLKNGDGQRWDHLAVVMGDEVRYIPDLDDLGRMPETPPKRVAPIHSRTCDYCGDEILTNNSGKRFCGKGCGALWRRRFTTVGGI